MEELNAIIDEKYDFVESAEDRFGEDTGDVTENEIGSKESPEYNPAPEYQTVPPENIPYDTETPRLVVNPEKLRGVMLEESGIPRKDFSAIRGIPARDLETLIESDSTLHRGTQSSIKKFIAMRDAFKILDSTLVPKGNETMEKFLERGTQEIASRYDVDEVVSALKKTLARRPREWSA